MGTSPESEAVRRVKKTETIGGSSGTTNHPLEPYPEGAVTPNEVVDVLALLQMLMGLLYLSLSILGHIKRKDKANNSSQTLGEDEDNAQSFYNCTTTVTTPRVTLESVYPDPDILLIHIVEGLFMAISGAVNKFPDGLTYLGANKGFELVLRTLTIFVNLMLLGFNTLELWWPPKPYVFAVWVLFVIEFVFYFLLIHYTCLTIRDEIQKTSNPKPIKSAIV